ncbi:spore coat associated protein CotJA [Tepidibacter aestuarii]|nr:spore coat associated protein CotJA [Tepidibacter aestuarii]CAH2211768.1 Spore coat associated protein JA (CotJA) [Tepidibacter aestuarii]
MKLARPYVSIQKYMCMYPLSKGFKKGTIFPELYKPYKKGSNKKCKK